MTDQADTGANSLPVLCLDFDGVLHSYTSGWRGATIIPDAPVQGAIEFLKNATGNFRVAIFSSRSHQDGGVEAMKIWLRIVIRERYGMTPFWFDLIEWPIVKPPAHVTIDDRAITFTGYWPTMAELRAFKPWNKKEDTTA